jgi:hypothetical protein
MLQLVGAVHHPQSYYRGRKNSQKRGQDGTPPHFCATLVQIDQEPMMRFPTIAVIFAGALLVAPAVHAQFPSPMLPEKTTRISDHVQVILGFPNVAIITGSQATLVVDTGLGPSNGATVARVAGKLSQVKNCI